MPMTEERMKELLEKINSGVELSVVEESELLDELNQGVDLLRAEISKLPDALEVAA